MKTILFIFSLSLFLQEPEPYPGQRDHARPPADWFCSREATDKAHWCLCSGMQENPKCPMPKPDPETPPVYDGDENEGGEPAGPPEDKTCKTYCHRDHCNCKVSCKDTGMHNHTQMKGA